MVNKIAWLTLIWVLLLLPVSSQEVYFSPQDSSTESTKDVEVYVDATNFQGGQLEITYNPECVRVTKFVNNTSTFPFSEWNSSIDGREFITFVANASSNDSHFFGLNDTHPVGTLTIQCMKDSCSTPLQFDNNSLIFDLYGDEISLEFIDGSFECKPSSSQTGQSKGGGGGDGGGGALPLPSPTATQTPSPTPTATPFIPPKPAKTATPAETSTSPTTIETKEAVTTPVATQTPSVIWWQQSTGIIAIFALVLAVLATILYLVRRP